ncbi:MAG: site-specific integrase [Coriobacteriales bacterium]|jgi:integrase|nr:site-specific integrase [Coriobacteriales bacterium]
MTRITGAGAISKYTRKDKKTGRKKVMYRIRCSTGFDLSEKKYTYTPWECGYETKSAAKKALDELRERLAGGARLDAGTILFNDYATDYLATKKGSGLSPATLRYYDLMVRHLIGYLGDMLVREIDTVVIKAVLRKHGSRGSTDGVKRLLAVLKQILNEAVTDDIIMRNPAAAIKPPRVTKRDIKPLDTQGVKKLVDALNDYDSNQPTGYIAPVKPGAVISAETLRATSCGAHVMAARLALASGARRGEVLGLVWSCVDFDRSQIRIVQQQTSTGLRQTKTAAGRRTVRLDNGTIEHLRGWKSRQAEYLLQLGIRQDEQTPVITNEVGTFHDSDGFSRWWRGFCKSYGIECRFHDLRHTQATLLIANGADIKTVQHRLGHETASITIDLYSHYMDGMDAKAAETIGTILNASASELGKVVSL